MSVGSSAKEALIIDAVRTPRGRGKAGKGALSGLHPQVLLAQALNHLAKKSGVNKEDVEDVVIGCVTQAKEQGANVARNAVLYADWPLGATGVTLNRFCGSGAQAVNFAAMGVLSGQQDVVVAGGVESMSRVPMGSDVQWLDADNLALRAKLQMVPQGISADLIATLEGFSRADVDAFALASQHKAEAAQKEGRFAKSLFTVVDLEGKPVLDRDEYPRAGATIDALTKLEPAFAGMGAAKLGMNGETLDELALAKYPEAKAINHVHTAGNSSGIVDGAAAVLLGNQTAVDRTGIKPRARIRAFAACAEDPCIMLTGPAEACRIALRKARMHPTDVHLWEINEAFASVALYFMDQLHLDHAKVNVNGGAIAMGHPLGATGAVILGTLLDELERRNQAVGVATLCVAGGMAVATVIERV